MAKSKSRVIPITMGRRKGSVTQMPSEHDDNVLQFQFESVYAIRRVHKLARGLVESPDSILKNKAKVIVDKIERIGELSIDSRWSEKKTTDVEDLLIGCAEFLSLILVKMTEEGDLYHPEVVLGLLWFVDPVGSDES